MENEQRTYAIRSYGAVIVIFIASILAMLESVRILRSLLQANSPGTIPVFASSVMLLTSMVILLETIRSVREETSGAEPFPSLGQALAAAARAEVPGSVALTILALVVYAVLLPIIGFKITTLAFLFGGATYLSHGKWKSSALFSVVTLVLIILIFQIIFKVVLP